MKRRPLILLLSSFLFLNAGNAPKPTMRPGKDLALFFAVSNYDQWDDLKNPIAEAEAIAKDLRELYDFQTEVVKDPTKAEIQAKIEEYRKKTYTGDAQLLIFFTGHGEYLENTREGFFIPKDAKRNDALQDSYLPYLRLQRWIETLPCRHILLAIDACFSGTFDDDIALKGEPGKRPGQSDWREQYISQTLQYRSRLFMASGAKVRTPDKSAFAEQFLNALRSFGGDDRLVSFTELWGYVQRANPKPCAAKFGDHEAGGDFLLVYAPANQGKPAPGSTDTDGDGIPNADDACPDIFGTAKARGCPDADDDGVPDQSDRCKYAPGLARWQGCPDTDGDGIPDHEDKCPAEKGDISLEGCPQADNMVLIRGGTFQMGSNDGESDEKPVHSVTLSDFYLSKYEVTVAEFRTFVEASGYRTDAEKEGSSRAYEDGKWVDKAGRNWRHDPEGNSANDKHPVINVSWNDATEYCKWLSQKTGKTYRLPTEAEWEYAAGNGSRHTKYSWGNGYPVGKNGGNVADETGASKFNWAKNASNIFLNYADGFASTAPIGSFNPNDFGLYDMTGNVWEWCSDWYGSDYYKSSPSQDPAGPASDSLRVVRGGAWLFYPQYCRVANRVNSIPDHRYNYVGFRLARTR
jgi:formylglycine-generating enzyme required for sulfatase activity